MRLESIIKRPSFVLSFSEEEVRRLDELAHHHYDYRCVRMAEFGGKIYGLASCVRLGVPPSAEFDWSEVDLLCKVLEQGDLPELESLLKLNQILTNSKFEESKVEVQL